MSFTVKTFCPVTKRHLSSVCVLCVCVCVLRDSYFEIGNIPLLWAQDFSQRHEKAHEKHIYDPLHLYFSPLSERAFKQVI